MYQCMSCEDWFHEICLNLRDADQPRTTNNENSEDAGPTLRLPRSNFDAFVCSECVLTRDLDLLRRYAGTPGFVLLEAMMKEENAEEKKERSEEQNEDDSASAIPLKFSNKREHSEESNKEGESDAKRVKTDEGAAESQPQPVQQCHIPEPHTTSQQVLTNLRQDPPSKPPSNAPRADMFLLHGWREKWCKCENCLSQLSKHPWLIAEEATYEPQEEEQSEKTLLQLGTEALNSLPREKALDGLKAYEKMSTTVKDFLKPFADSGKTVEADDIKHFFQEQQHKLGNNAQP